MRKLTLQNALQPVLTENFKMWILNF